MLCAAQVRARAEIVVDDSVTAEDLKPWYNQFCKRPCFHDEYLSTFNKDHVHLVDCAPTDTDGGGVQLINEKGPVIHGEEYPLDVLIYATGFEWMATATFNMVVGRGGTTLADKWSTGTKTLFGVHSRGFPNLFIMQGPQGGGGSFNFTGVIEQHANYISWVLDHMRDNGHNVMDVDQEMEDEYAQHCAEADTGSRPLRDCISYYNGEGESRPGDLAYYGGRQWNKRVEMAQKTLVGYEFA